jgi:Integrase zinc binding domain
LPSKLSQSLLYNSIYQDDFDLITRNSKIVLGPALFADILAWYNINLNHLGKDCTYNTIHATFYTPNMVAKAREYIANCQICEKSKISTKKYGLLPESNFQCDPWEVIEIDLFCPWSFTDINNISHQIQGLSIIDVAMQ